MVRKKLSGLLAELKVWVGMGPVVKSPCQGGFPGRRGVVVCICPFGPGGDS